MRKREISPHPVTFVYKYSPLVNMCLKKSTRFMLRYYIFSLIGRVLELRGDPHPPSPSSLDTSAELDGDSMCSSNVPELEKNVWLVTGNVAFWHDSL